MKSKITKYLMLGLMMLFSLTTIYAQGLTRSIHQSDVSIKSETNRNTNLENYSIQTRGTVYFEEGFESNSFSTNGWVTTDSDGDGNNWFVSNSLTPHSGTHLVGSASWSNTALTPDNWLATKGIDLSGASGTIILEYWARAQDQTWPSEFYGVYASTSGNLSTDFTGDKGKELFSEKMKVGTDVDNNLYVKRTINISEYIGDTVFLAFRHYNCSDWYVLDIDDISVYESTVVDVGITEVVSPSNVESCSLNEEETVTVTLFNFGGVALSDFPVSYTFNGNTVVDTFREELLPATSMDFTFEEKIKFTELGYFKINFEVNAEGDGQAANNKIVYNVSNTDAKISVVVSTDSGGGQSWEIVNSSGTVIANHGAYQWNLTDTTKVCVINNDCYTFKWYGGEENTVKIFYNDELINEKVAKGDYVVYSLGANCKPVDIVYLSQSLADYGIVGSTDIGGTFLNIGSENITSFDVMYTIDGIQSEVVTIDNVNIPTGEYYDFVHSTPYDFANVGKYAISVTVSNFNGTFTPAVDKFDHTYYVLSSKPTTRILGEEATGTWCGWCVRGHVFMDYMDNKYPDSWVGVAVHNGDPMVVSAYDTGIGNFISGYPSGLVNRYEFSSGYDIDPLKFEDAYTQLNNQLVPANVDIAKAVYNDTTKVLSFTIETTFAGEIDKDFNVLGVITEDKVKGTDNGYDQANYYSGGTTVMGGYENLANPVPAADMVYQNVARAMIGSWTGVTNVIENPTEDNGKYSYTFSYTVPVGENINNMNLIGVLLDKKTGNVINVIKKSFTKVVGTNNIMPDLVEFKIYPNPSSDVLNLDINLIEKEMISVYITDMSGRVVKSIYNNFETNSLYQSINIGSFNSGVYLLNVQSKNGTSVQKFIKQ